MNNETQHTPETEHFVKEWISPINICPEYHKSNLKKLNSHVAKIVHALVALGCYDFKIMFYLGAEKVVKITNLPTWCRYNYIHLYEDGYVSYHSITDSTLFEGRTYRISLIKKDIQLR